MEKNEFWRGKILTLGEEKLIFGKENVDFWIGKIDF